MAKHKGEPTEGDNEYQKGYAEGERRVQEVIGRLGLQSAIDTCEESQKLPLKKNLSSKELGLRKAIEDFLSRHKG